MATYSDLMQMCRLCLVKDQVSLPIFGGQGDIQQIFLKITACLPVKVSREDNLPKSICDGCSYKLDLLYQFWNTSSNSEKQLIDWLTAAGVDPKHKSLEPIGLATQPNVILKQEPVTELDNISSDTQNYLMQQQQLAYKPEEYEEPQQDPIKSTKQKATSDSADETPSKRPRRVTRNTKSVQEVDDSEEDYGDNTESGIAKTEDESEEEEDEEDEDDGDDGDDGDDMADPDFITAEEEEDTDQPGPSGVSGNKSASATSHFRDQNAYYKQKYGLKDCIVFVGNQSEFDKKQYRYVKTQAYCDIDQTNILKGPRLKYKCDDCNAKFRDHYRLILHREEIHDSYTTSSSNASSDETYVPDDIVIDEDSANEATDLVTTNEKEEVEPKVPEIHKGENSNPGVVENNTDNLVEKVSTKRFRCTKCLKVFRKKTLLIDHLKVVHNVFACTLCPEAFYSKVNFNKHLKQKHYHVNGKWRCKICCLSFLNFDNLMEHNFEKHKPTCGLCSQDFHDVAALISHKCSRHNIPISIICNICGITTLDEDDLQRHKQLHNRTETFNCDLCSLEFSSEEEYISHVDNTHVGKPTLSQPTLLNHTQKFPSLKMKITKTQSQANEIGNSSHNNESYVVSQPPASSLGTVPIQSAECRPSTSHMTPARSKYIEANNTTIGVVVDNNSASLNNKGHKLLVVDKTTNQAYLIPAMMVNQDGQMKLAVKKGALREPVMLKDQPLMQQAVNNVMNPTLPNIQPALSKVVPPIGNIVQPGTNLPSTPANNLPLGVSNDVVPTVSNMYSHIGNTFIQPTSTSNIPSAPFSNIIKPKLPLALAVPQEKNPCIPTSTLKTICGSVADSVKELEKGLSQFGNVKPPLKQYVGGKIIVKKIIPSLPRENKPIYQKGSALDLNLSIIQRNLVIDDDINKLDVNVVEESDPKAQHNTELTIEQTLSDVAANDHKPKIFLKPLSQLLEKPKPIDTNLGEPSTSKNSHLIKVAPENVPVHIRKVNEKSKSTLEKNTNATKITSLDKSVTGDVTIPSDFQNSALKKITPDKVPEYIRKVNEKLQANPEAIVNSPKIKMKLQKLIDKAEEDIGISPYTCKICGVGFKRFSKLQQHQTKLKCKLCDYTGCKLKSLDVHYRIQHNFHNQCVSCDVRFTTSDLLKEHNKNVHLCGKCQKFYTSIAKHTTMYICQKCNDFECTSKELNEHYQSKHNIFHVCTPCKQFFADENQFTDHKKNVHFCGKCKSYKMDLAVHQKFCKGDHSYSEDHSQTSNVIGVDSD